MHKWRIGTLTMGMFLIALGVILIMARVSGISVIEQIINWWPVIIIMLGVEILLVSILGRSENFKASFDGFSIFIVIVIILFCLGTFTAENIMSGISNFSVNGFHPISIMSKYDSSFKKNLTISPKGKDKFTLDNEFGSIRVNKGSSENIEIEANIRVRNNDEEYAKSISDLMIELNESGPIKVSSKRREYLNDRNKVQEINIDYIVKVPVGMDININNKFGSVLVENAPRSVNVENSN